MIEPLKKPTQCQRILEVLQNANGEFVSGQYFLHTMMLSQYHARIWDLQKQGYNIVASDSTDNYGFKFYKLVENKVQSNLFDSNIKTKEEVDKMYQGY